MGKPDILEYGYCIHLSTGKDLGDMCETCCYYYCKSYQYKIRHLKFKIKWFVKDLITTFRGNCLAGDNS